MSRRVSAPALGRRRKRLHAARWAFATAILVAAQQAAGAQDRPDISVQQAKEFSIYAPRSCQKAERVPFDLVLECNFHGKRATFFLKEIQHRPRTSVPEIDDAAREIFWQTISEIDPQMNKSTTIYDRGGWLADDGESAGWWTVNADDKSSEKRVLFRTHFEKTYGAGVALVISEFDGPATSKTLASGITVTTRRVPQEVMTVLGSFDKTKRLLRFRMD